MKKEQPNSLEAVTRVSFYLHQSPLLGQHRDKLFGDRIAYLTG